MYKIRVLGLLICCTVFYARVSAQEMNAVEEIYHFQNELNASFADPEHSPLLAEDLANFSGLDFYPVDLKFRVTARLELTPETLPFEMPTTTDRKPLYRQYGVALFVIDSVQYRLSVYQNLELAEKEEYADYLFIPFTDLTSGDQSYGGGRYIDLRIPENTDSLIIDFNQCYNPYCAYNHRYSCPVPPPENDLNIEIRAGVKKFKH